MLFLREPPTLLDQTFQDRKGIAGLLYRLRDDSGAILIEMAIGYIVMVTMLFVVIESCMMGYTYSVLSEAAKEGVRYACVHGTNSATCNGPSAGCDTSAANTILAVKNSASGLGANVTGMIVSVTYPDGLSTGTSRVQVAVSYAYKPIFNMPGTAHTFNVSSAGRIMY